jgi:hypothetical protein
VGRSRHRRPDIFIASIGGGPGLWVSNLSFFVGYFFDDAGGLCESCCRFQGGSRTVFVTIGIGGGLSLL